MEDCQSREAEQQTTHAKYIYIKWPWLMCVKVIDHLNIYSQKHWKHKKRIIKDLYYYNARLYKIKYLTILIFVYFLQYMCASDLLFAGHKGRHNSNDCIYSLCVTLQAGRGFSNKCQLILQENYKLFSCTSESGCEVFVPRAAWW